MADAPGLEPGGRVSVHGGSTPPTCTTCGSGGTGRRTRLRAWRPYSIGHESSTLSIRTINAGDRRESLWRSPARSGLLPWSRQIPAGSLRLHPRPRSSPRPAAAQDQRPPGGPEGDSSRAARPGRVAQYAAVGQQQTASVVTRKSECNSLLRLHSLPLWRRQSARLSEKQEVRVRYPATAPVISWVPRLVGASRR